MKDIDAKIELIFVQSQSGIQFLGKIFNKAFLKIVWDTIILSGTRIFLFIHV